MTKVDSKGLIVLPQEVRDRLGITPGTEVDIREKDGKAVVEPEDSPDEILDKMEQLIEEASSNQRETTPISEGADPVAHRHRDAVQHFRGGAPDLKERTE
ncbi:AbrB/MazE/SpoVT family DNA-binding domain-containing protein [Halorubrum ezzemoulense]|uniref:AbrB/MazE/SpoVT family DNA-binding domain-containing protein n=1 Tax=Halorubrum ezzemoulense TaxID=337243 RepID=UPI00232F7DDF|nr:AbrB/MazE/SpoVT family DNA-binding domain-containing protein [Halorubrum ezzemoulense]MDB2242803.1 AbrB/MazE/SpoVT family DNA-binding domain-containing protein [Halorubrum ezzemoulense]